MYIYTIKNPVYFSENCERALCGIWLLLMSNAFFFFNNIYVMNRVANGAINLQKDQEKRTLTKSISISEKTGDDTDIVFSNTIH